MSLKAGTAFVDVAMGDTKNLEKDIETAGERAGDKAGKKAGSGFRDKFKDGVSNVSKFLDAGLFAGVGAAIGSLAIGGVQAVEEANKIAAQTAAVIKSTGGIAGVTAEHIDNLSASLMRKRAVDDEVFKSGANLLLTFTNIRNVAGKGNDIFNRTLAITHDLSVAMGKDLNSSILMVGKALNDPLKGMKAMSKAGIQFTKDQQEQIKKLVAAGKHVQAQKILLKELEVQFGGSAEAAVTSSQKFSVAWGELQETVGELLLPTVEKTADELRTLVEIVQSPDATKTFFKKIWEDLQQANPEIVRFSREVKDLLGITKKPDTGPLGGEPSKMFKELTEDANSSKNTIMDLNGVIQDTARLSKDLKFTPFTPDNVAAIDGLRGSLFGLNNELSRHGTMSNNMLGLYKQIFTSYGAVSGAAQNYFDLLNSKGTQSLNQLQGGLSATGKATQDMSQQGAGSLNMFGQVLGQQSSNTQRFSSQATQSFSVLGASAQRNFGATGAAAQTTGRSIETNIGGSAPRAAMMFSTHISRLPGIVSGLASRMFSAGAALINGLISGIGSKIGAAIQKVKDGIAAIDRLLPGSPAKEGPWSGKGWVYFGGQAISEALAAGITSKMGTVQAATQRLAEMGNAEAHMAMSQSSSVSVGGFSSSPMVNVVLSADSRKFSEWIRYEVRNSGGGSVQAAFGAR